jgi:hypothetical protein
MAKMLGESARYLSEESARRHERVLLHCAGMVGVCGLVEGLCVARFVHIVALPLWFAECCMVLTIVGFWILNKWGIPKFKVLEKERLAARRGASGEIHVGNVLSDLPDDYYVINDLATPCGNLDHVVVSPKGVFVLDTKNWRGVVRADGRGELLLNDQLTDKRFVSQLVARMMGIRDKVRVLAPKPNPRYRAVLVFTSARVEAKWGTTGSAHCITDEQLVGYILDGRTENPLRPNEVKQIAQAFLGLAHVDQDFSRRSNSAATSGFPTPSIP